MVLGDTGCSGSDVVTPSGLCLRMGTCFSEIISLLSQGASATRVVTACTDNHSVVAGPSVAALFGEHPSLLNEFYYCHLVI